MRSGEILTLVLAPSGAALAHFALARLGRRLPRWAARRAGRTPAPEVREPRGVRLLVVSLQAGCWLAAAWWLGEVSPGLRAARAEALGQVADSLRAPLFTMNERSYSAFDLLLLPTLVGAAWIAASLATRLVRAWLLAAAGLEPGVQETIAVLLRYAIAFVATLVALQVWGVDLRTLAIAASVLGVGIGFGLQNIANNLVSGLLINFERPVRPGDFIHVGAFAGTVERVGARSTAIRTLDRVTILVPNARLLESEVVNWSHGDPISRVHVPVGLAYGTDPRLARRALLEAARDHAGVLSEPRPQVQLRSFGESALEFELLVWTRDPKSQQQLVSELNFRVVESLRRHGLQVPFPQRDLHLRSPSLERALRAFGERAGAPADEAQPPAADPAPAPAEPWLPPEEWSDEDLARLAARMRGEGGVPVADRRHLLATYRRCFVGSEAVDWLAEREALTRAEAVALGERLRARGELQHVLDEHGFRDGHFFYRFADAADA